MFKQLIKNLTDSTYVDSVASPDMRSVSVQLMLEVARSDASIDETEREAIEQAILRKSEFSAEELEKIMAESEQAVEKSISFYQHVRLVNEQFDQTKKIALIEQMWQVALADKKLDPYEEAFIRQIADLIHVRHRNFMQAKHRVLDAGK